MTKRYNMAIPIPLAREMFDAMMTRGRWYTRRGYEVPDRTTRSLEFLAGVLGVDREALLEELFR